MPLASRATLPCETIGRLDCPPIVGAPLAALPAVQAKLADAALARDGLLLAAWSLADGETNAADVLLWAGAACRDVTMIAQQAHGAIGFALESNLHRAYRRAKTVQVWAAAVGPETAAR